MYTLTKVTKDYAKGRETVHALQGVDLEIADGEWLSIQGPTGHGKSTLLQILGGLDRATGRRRRWPPSGLPTGPVTCPRSCPAVSSSASPSPAPWSSSPRSCWRTSPPA